MFTLLVLFTGGAITILLERRDGLLRRLASSPMSRSAVVAGKWGARLIMGVVQIGVAMLIGRLLFGIDWQPLGPVALVLFAYASLAASLAILLGNFAQHRRPGDRHRRGGDESAGRAGRLLVADRSDAGVGAAAVSCCSRRAGRWTPCTG